MKRYTMMSMAGIRIRRKRRQGQQRIQDNDPTGTAAATGAAASSSSRSLPTGKASVAGSGDSPMPSLASMYTSDVMDITSTANTSQRSLTTSIYSGSINLDQSGSSINLDDDEFLVPLNDLPSDERQKEEQQIQKAGYHNKQAAVTPVVSPKSPSSSSSSPLSPSPVGRQQLTEANIIDCISPTISLRDVSFMKKESRWGEGSEEGSHMSCAGTNGIHTSGQQSVGDPVIVSESDKVAGLVVVQQKSG